MKLIERVISNLKTDIKNEDLDKVVSWKGLDSDYRRVFAEFMSSVSDSLAECDYIQVYSDAENPYVFMINIFGEQKTIFVRMQFYQVKGFSLLGTISFFEEGGPNGIELIMPINKDGIILDQQDLRPVDGIIGNIVANAKFVVGSVIAEVIPEETI